MRTFKRLWPFLLVVFCFAGCSNDISEDAALDQVEQSDAIEAEQMGGLDEDEHEAAMDAEQR